MLDVKFPKFYWAISAIFVIVGIFGLGAPLSRNDSEPFDYTELDANFDNDQLSGENANKNAIEIDGRGNELEINEQDNTALGVVLNKEEKKPAGKILLDVPFTSQAPFAEWADKRQQDGCEEASVLMAVKWARGESLDKKTAKAEILAMAAYQEKEYGSFVDTSAQDTIERLIKGYYKHANAIVRKSVSPQDIINELAKGNLVLAPCQGQRLGNPNFTAPGPERHMLVIRGYDPGTDEFITNDPGTRLGEGYRYKSDILMYAILDYPTGDHAPIVKEEKNVIVITR